ncbi:DUF1819 family protein [candidate division KSB1 bacterium]|nr:DUF1819 family protein [candidate division KSB1 bacterium]
MTKFQENKYKARFHHFGAMIEECRLLMMDYNPELDKKTWIEQVIQKNLPGKSSRNWVQEFITGVFFPRYVNGYLPDAWIDLKLLIQNGVHAEVIKCLFYYLTVKTDQFIYDFILNEIFTRYFVGRLSLSAQDVVSFIQQIPQEKFNNPWSDYTQQRLGRGVLATLRDFGILTGRNQKKIANYYLPLEAFIYIAFHLKQKIPSGEKLLEHDDWKLFLLKPKFVERMFLEAHQLNLLNYQAAGAIIRIEFPFQNTGELVHAISAATVRTISN